MTVKKKIRDITKEEFGIWQNTNCKIYGLYCTGCPFKMVQCRDSRNEIPWYKNKEMFSDRFLDQEIKIGVPEILDDAEKRYLSAVIKPFRKRVDSIMKISDPLGSAREYIFIKLDGDFFALPYFEAGTMYQGMELDRPYTLKELRL